MPSVRPPWQMPGPRGPLGWPFVLHCIISAWLKTNTIRPHRSWLQTLMAARAFMSLHLLGSLCAISTQNMSSNLKNSTLAPISRRNSWVERRGASHTTADRQFSLVWAGERNVKSPSKLCHFEGAILHFACSRKLLQWADRPNESSNIPQMTGRIWMPDLDDDSICKIDIQWQTFPGDAVWPLLGSRCSVIFVKDKTGPSASTISSGIKSNQK